MIISNSFRKFYFGGIIRDIKLKLDFILWNGIKFNIKPFNSQEVHEILKILVGKEKSLREMNNKEVVQLIEDIRLLIAENGVVLEVDNDEWERLIKELDV